VAARREIRRLLDGAIDDLPEAFRLVLVARDGDGMSVEATSQVLGVKPEAARTHLHRAQRLLRTALDQRLGDTLREAFPLRWRSLRPHNRGGPSVARPRHPGAPGVMVLNAITPAASGHQQRNPPGATASGQVGTSRVTAHIQDDGTPIAEEA
jgi:hypothetical protein